MKRLSIALAVTAAVAALGATVALTDANAFGGRWNPGAQQNFYCGSGAGPMMGGFGPGPMMGQGYGPGPMMGQGYGPGAMMGQGTGPAAMLALRADADRDGTLTVDEVKTFFDVNAMPRNANVKLGSVTEKDADTLTVTMVTADGATTVHSFDVPRKVDAAAIAPQGRGGFGRQGHRGWHHGNFGPGMMGYGPMGYGPMGYGPMGYGAAPQAELTVDAVKARVESRIARWNSDAVSVGAVTETDKGTISAEIVTKDGTVVRRMEFDKKSGRAIR